MGVILTFHTHIPYVHLLSLYSLSFLLLLALSLPPIALLRIQLLSGHLWNTCHVPLERMFIVCWILSACVWFYRFLVFLLAYISLPNFCLDVLSINLNGVVKPPMIIMHYIPSFNCQFLHHIFWYSIFRNFYNIYHFILSYCLGLK